MIVTVVILSFLLTVMTIVTVFHIVMTKSVLHYLKKVDRHPTDEELNACIRETVREIFFK